MYCTSFVGVLSAQALADPAMPRCGPTLCFDCFALVAGSARVSHLGFVPHAASGGDLPLLVHLQVTVAALTLGLTSSTIGVWPAHRPLLYALLVVGAQGVQRLVALVT